MNPITSATAAALSLPAQAALRAGSQLVQQQPVAAASSVLSLSAQGLQRLHQEVQEAADAATRIGDSATGAVDGLVDGGIALVEAAWQAGEDAVGALADAGEAVYDAAADAVGGVGTALGHAADAVGDAAASVASGIKDAAGQVASYALIGAQAISRGVDEIV